MKTEKHSWHCHRRPNGHSLAFKSSPSRKHNLGWSLTNCGQLYFIHTHKKIGIEPQGCFPFPDRRPEQEQGSKARNACCMTANDRMVRAPLYFSCFVFVLLLVIELRWIKKWPEAQITPERPLKWLVVCLSREGNKILNSKECSWEDNVIFQIENEASTTTDKKETWWLWVDLAWLTAFLLWPDVLAGI